MMELERILSREPRKSFLLIIVKRRRFGIGPNTALSIDSDCEPLENVKVWSSTLVMLYFAIAPTCRAVL